MIKGLLKCLSVSLPVCLFAGSALRAASQSDTSLPAGAPAGMRPSTRSRALGDISVSSMPQHLQIGARERATVNYFIRNERSLPITISGSQLYYFLPNGQKIGTTASQLLSRSVQPGQSMLLSMEIVISDSIADACRVAGSDTVNCVRVFQGMDVTGGPLTTRTDTRFFQVFQGNRQLFSTGMVAATRVRCVSSQSGAAQIDEIRITAPSDDLVVPKNGVVGARALIRGKGNGVFVGRWLIDGRPFEGFDHRIRAGVPTEVVARRPIPTLDIGEHRIQLEIVSPNRVLSREVRFSVSGFTESGRSLLVTPSRGETVSSTEMGLDVQWLGVAGASGYEIGFAKNLAALGFTETFTLLTGTGSHSAFKPQEMVVQRRVDSAITTSLRLTRVELDRLAAAGEVYWTVRPLLAPGNRPAPDRAAVPQLFRVAASVSSSPPNPQPDLRMAGAVGSSLPKGPAVMHANAGAFEQAGQAEQPPKTDQVSLTPKDLRLKLDTEFSGSDQSLSLDNLSLKGVVEGAFRDSRWGGSMDVTSSMGVRGGSFNVRRALGSVHFDRDRFTAGIGDAGMQTSEFTANGMVDRSLQTAFTLGDMRLGFSKSIGRGSDTSNLGRGTGLFNSSIETLGYETGRGIRLIRTESNDTDNSASASSQPFPFQVRSRIWSVAAKYPVVPSVSVEAESAWSSNTLPDLDGNNQRVKGQARRADIAYTHTSGVNLNVGFREIGSSYLSPAAQTLATNLRGWDTGLAAPIGRYTTMNARFAALRNGVTANIPAGSNDSYSLQLGIQAPRLPPLQLMWEQIRAASDPLVPGGTPTATREQRLTVGASGEVGRLLATTSYTFSLFADRVALADPTLDVPADNRTKSWTLGLSWREGNLDLRGDWSDNSVRRFARDTSTLDLLTGIDAQDHTRVEAEYRLARQASVSAVWSRARQVDVLGLSPFMMRDIALRVNWLVPSAQKDGYVVSLELRSFRSMMGGSYQNDRVISLVLNNSNLFSFR